MTNFNDLRYIRTEAAIRSAFMELVSSAPVASVTATAICNKATISRNAFYLHHASVAELYAALVREVVEDVREESLASVDNRTTANYKELLETGIVNALARHEELLRALLPSDDGSLSKRLAEGIEDAYVEAALRFGEHGGSREHRLACAFAAWAHVGFAARWISLTDSPIRESLDSFKRLQSGLTEQADRYLSAGESQRSSRS